MKSACMVAVLCATFVHANAQAAGDTTVNARDLFWSGAQISKVSPNAAKLQVAPANPGVERSKENEHTKAATSSANGAASVPRLTANRVSELGYGEAPRLEASAAGLLGLRYTMLERDETTGEYSEVLPSEIFRAGDRVRLSVMPNQSGYLYIVQQGTSGEWSFLFPSGGPPTELQHLAGGRVYEFPPEENHSFQFDRNAGTEHLYLVLMRAPATNIDEVTSLLRGSAEEHNHSMTASRHMDNSNVCASQTAIDAPASRDLLITTVGSQRGQSGMEHAVYVVNRVSASDKDATIVACLSISHQ